MVTIAAAQTLAEDPTRTDPTRTRLAKHSLQAAAQVATAHAAAHADTQRVACADLRAGLALHIMRSCSGNDATSTAVSAALSRVSSAKLRLEQAVAAMGQVVEADIAADAEDVAEASVVAKTETAAETDVVTKEADVIAEEVSVVAEADVAAEAADVKEAKAELPPMTEDTVIDGDEIRSRLQKLKVVELKEELRKHGMPVSGKKADLVERLVSAMVEEQE